MPKKWKVAIGVIAAAVVVVGIALAIWGVVTFRSRGYEYGWVPGAYKWEPELATQLEVELVDDDGDGVPDRGVIEVPTEAAFGWGFGPGRGSHFGRGFGPGRGLLFGPAFGLFLIVGGLSFLAFFALLIGLRIVFFHHRFGPHPPWAYPPAPDTSQQEK